MVVTADDALTVIVMAWIVVNEFKKNTKAVRKTIFDVREKITRTE
jgi:hypothetical protein